MKIEISVANDLDVPNILDLLRELFAELNEENAVLEKLDTDLIRSVLEHGSTTVLKAVCENEMAAVATITESVAIYAGGIYGTIDELFVKPGFRSQQIGKQMIEEIKAIAVERDWTRIVVTAPPANNERQLSFYYRCGFEFTGPKLRLIQP